jgi:hypothetical protein
VNSWVIAKHFADAGYPIQFFAIERFCSRLGTEDFDISWSGGYYGDEIDYVRLGDAAKQQIMHIKNLRGVDLVEFALKNEYSNVLPQYKNRQWEFTQNALVDNLILGVPNRRDINKDRVNFYKSHIGGKSDQYNPVLLCELHEQIYKVIDGYHRYTALKELGIKKVDIIYFERDGNKSQGEFELGGAL